MNKLKPDVVQQVIKQNKMLMKAFKIANIGSTIKEYGDTLLENFDIKTDKLSGEIYFYNDRLGFYDNEFALDRIHQEITDMLDNSYSDKNLKQITTYVKIKTGIDLRTQNNGNCICLNNGIFDIGTMKIIDHSPEMFVSFRLNVDYVKEEGMEEWKEYTKGLFHKLDFHKAQEACGNILATHYITKKLAYFVGEKDSGKSTFLSILQGFLGRKNYSVLSLDDINKGQYAMAELYRKRANICSEINYNMNFKNIATLKKLTGGDEFLARRIYSSPFPFVNNAKIFLAGNGIPNVADMDSDDAFYGRWDFITCPNSFDADDTFIERYTTPEMKSQLFNWMLEGYTRLKNQKWVFTNPISKKDVYEAFRHSKITRDTFLDWYSSCCVQDEGYELVSNLFRACRDWHAEQGLTTYPINLNQFGRAMNNKLAQTIIPTSDFYPTVDGKQEHAYRGVKIW